MVERRAGHGRRFDYAWSEIRRQRLQSAHLLDEVAETTVVDDRMLRIRLHRPQAHFPYLLALPTSSPWPRHLCERLPDKWLNPPHLACNGAFALAGYDEEHALLVANDRWRGDRGNVGEVVVTFMSGEETVAAWERGELDLTMNLVSPLPERVVAERAPGLSTVYVGFVPDAPPFDDVRVRRAFAHGLDRARWARDRGAVHEPAVSGGLVPPAMPGHSHRIGLEYDLARARELLAEAGYPEGRGLGEIRLASPDPAWAEPIASQFREALGARVTVVAQGFDEDPRQVDAACWVHGWNADFPDPTQYVAIMVTRMPARYRDDEVLGVLEQALGARDRDERLRLTQEIERTWISDRVALVPLGYQSIGWLRRPWVHGFWTTPILPGRISDLEVRR